jgi:hypothetical protein
VYGFLYHPFVKDAAGFIKAHDIGPDKYDFDKFVGGHLTRLGTKNAVVIQKEFIDDLNILENWFEYLLFLINMKQITMCIILLFNMI